MIQKPRIRQWGLVGPAQSGKSSFSAANRRGSTFVVDTDGRYDAVEPLGEGDIVSASSKARRDPLTLYDEIESTADSGNLGTIVVDSISKLYSHHSRVASMRGRFSKGERKQMGWNPNKASDMVNKSDAISVVSNAAIYGADVHFIWHTRQGLNVDKFEMELKEAISDTEKQKLLESINVLLFFEFSAGSYQIRVEYARDFGGKPCNTGFTITDFPDNFWRNGAERIEDMIYARFGGAEEARKWGAEKLGKSADDLIDLYNDVRDRKKPQSAREMWLAWVDAVYHAVYQKNASTGRRDASETKPEPTERDGSPVPVEVKVPEEASPPPTAVAGENQESGDEFDEIFPPREESLQEVETPDTYKSGQPVQAKDRDDYRKYVERFKKPPFDEDQLRNAVAYHGEEW